MGPLFGQLYASLKHGGLPQVKEELLVEALTKRKTVTVNDKLILSYSHSEVSAGPPAPDFFGIDI